MVSNERSVGISVLAKCYQQFVRMMKGSCILVIVIVLVEESTTITRENGTDIPKEQWHQLQEPLRLCKEYLIKVLQTKMRNAPSCATLIPV